MDRVRIDNEPRGSATYYMAESPYVYGERIYEIEKMGDVVIISAQMDIGKCKGNSWRVVRSAEEYHDLIWKTKGEEVFACSFDLMLIRDPAEDQTGFPVKVTLDFLSKRLTLQVDPSLDADEKKHLADFYDMLTDEDYYLEQAIDEIGKELTGIKRFSIVGKVAFSALIIILMTGIILFDNEPEAEPSILTIVLGALPMIISICDGIRQHLLRRTVQRKLDALSKRKLSGSNKEEDPQTENEKDT